MLRVVALSLVVLVFSACGDDGSGGGDVDSGAGDACANGACVCPAQPCDNGEHCDGMEVCDPENALADSIGCVPGTPVVCNDHIDCTTDSCSNEISSCVFTAPDIDDDGHADMTCLDEDNEPFGNDCDDDDDDRFPGNTEDCDDHDEDCDDNTFGTTDTDGDSEVSEMCCNGDNCGSDCDDEDPARRSGQVEFCDEVDNNCDDIVDNNTRAVPWYPDGDGDLFGDPNGTIQLSCDVVLDHSVVPTDCDDGEAAINRAGTETCGGIDEDCDGMIDEDVTGCGGSGGTGGTGGDSGTGGNSGTGGDSGTGGTGGTSGTGGTGGSGSVCDSNNGGCDDIATCTDDNGAAVCTCPLYHNGNGVGANGCVAVDQCMLSNGGCGNAMYTMCSNGLGMAATCTDIDECANNNGGCGDSTYYECENNTGTVPTCRTRDLCLSNNGGCEETELCINNPGSAPSCDDLVLCAGSYLITTQAELEALAQLGCTEITGTLQISSSEIQNLTGLETIRRVGGELAIHGNAALVTLNGLHRLAEVRGAISIGYSPFGSGNPELLDVALTGLVSAGALEVAYNPKLTSLAGLGALAIVAGAASVHGSAGTMVVNANAALVTTAGLTQLQSIGGTFYVSGNPVLTTLSAPALTTTGGITLGGNAALSMLGNLASLETVTGAISISEPALTNLNALNAIESVGGNVTISGNPQLANLNGINIGTINGSLSIDNNPVLGSISGFAGLTNVFGNVFVHDNELLTSVSGFNALTEVGGLLEIAINPRLTDISGFTMLRVVNASFSIYRNPLLAQITGFDALTEVNSSFNIVHNPALTQFNAIDQLAYVGNDLRIEGNLVLNSLQGLRSGTLDFVGARTMIRINPALSACEVSAVQNGLVNFAGDNLNAGNQGCTVCAGATCMGVAGGTAGQSTVFGPETNFVDNSFTVTSNARLGLLANITEIQGDLIIQGVTANNLTGLNNLAVVGRDLTVRDSTTLGSLNGLNSLRTVGGNFLLYGNALTNINALGTLQTVGGSLQIENHASLASVNGLAALRSTGGLYLRSNAITNVNALSSLTTVDGPVEIRNNASLSNLNGLSMLSSIDGGLLVYVNGITNINGLSGLQGVGGDVEIAGNALTNLNGLGSLESVGGYLSIHDEAALTSAGLSALVSVGGNLYLQSLPLLANLTGLGPLDSIGGSLLIGGNATLSSITGLSPTTVATDLYITSNPTLSDCAVAAFRNGLTGWNGTDYSGSNLACSGTCSGAVCQ